jgi:hypothetical protein
MASALHRFDLDAALLHPSLLTQRREEGTRMRDIGINPLSTQVFVHSRKRRSRLPGAIAKRSNEITADWGTTAWSTQPAQPS